MSPPYDHDLPALRHKVSQQPQVTAQTARELLLALPGVEEGPCYGTSGFRVRRKFLARLRDNDATLVVKCGFDERDFRIQADPDTFFTTDHYRGYPTVLVRLSNVQMGDLRALLEHAWRCLAPKRLVTQYDGETSKSRKSATKERP